MSAATIETTGKTKEFFDQKLDFTISPEELNELLGKGEKKLVVDVRESKDFIRGHIPGAINLPTGHWANITTWSKDRPVIIYGYSELCHLAIQAAKVSAERGYAVMELEGGLPVPFPLGQIGYFCAKLSAYFNYARPGSVNLALCKI